LSWEISNICEVFNSIPCTVQLRCWLS